MNDDKNTIKWIVYLSFIGIIIFLVISTGTYKIPQMEYQKQQAKSTTEDNDDISYVDKQEKLYNESYEYTFTVKDDIKTIIYSGKYEDGVRTGYKQSNEIIKYKETEDNAYKITIDGEVLYSELYENFDANLFNLKDLFSKLNSQKSTIEKNNNLSTYCYDDIDGYKINVYTSSDKIEIIEIDGENLNYTFEFKY